MQCQPSPTLSCRGSPHPPLVPNVPLDPDDKESSGCLPSPTKVSLPICQEPCNGLEDNLKKEEQQDISTGKSVAPSKRKRASTKSVNFSGPSMLNSPDQKKQRIIAGKKTPLCKVRGSSLLEEPNSSLELSLLNATTQLTGTQSGRMLPQANLIESPPMLEWSILGHYETLKLLTVLLEVLYAKHGYTGALPELVNLGGHGNKPVKMLLVKILNPSFGLAIEVKRTLSLMNFEEELTLPTSCDGWIVTQCTWSKKGTTYHW